MQKAQKRTTRLVLLQKRLYSQAQIAFNSGH